MVRLCFVCKGNICRSAMAATVLRDKVKQPSFGRDVDISSAGIISYHVGKPIDPRAKTVLESNGYIVDHTARQIQSDDLSSDFLIAMDSSHVKALGEMVDSSRVELLSSFGDHGVVDVPDPYYGDMADFEKTYDMIKVSVDALAAWLIEEKQ